MEKGVVVSGEGALFSGHRAPWTGAWSVRARWRTPVVALKPLVGILCASGRRGRSSSAGQPLSLSLSLSLSLRLTVSLTRFSILILPPNNRTPTNHLRRQLALGTVDQHSLSFSSGLNSSNLRVASSRCCGDRSPRSSSCR